MYLAHNYSFLAFSAAMEGRKAETLAAVQSVAAAVPLDLLLAMGDSGWNLSQQYAALVRFGLWDEAIALGPPDARAPGLTAGYLFSRGVALAARGRLEDARAVLAQLRQLATATPNDAQAGFNTLRGILAVAEPIVAARIAATEQRNDEALRLLRQAVAAQDGLAYNEPADWFFPARHVRGSVAQCRCAPAGFGVLVRRPGYSQLRVSAHSAQPTGSRVVNFLVRNTKLVLTERTA